MWLKFCKENRGQVFVIWTILIPVILLLLGFGIDLGLIISKKQKIQDATDLAVLSGVQYLPLNPLGANNLAMTIFRENYQKTPKKSTIKFSSSGNGLDAKFEDTISLYFMPLIGINTVDILGKAEALSAPMYQPNYVVPIGIFHTTPLVYGVPVSIYGDLTDPIKGNFGLVDPTNNRSMLTKDMEDWITGNYLGERGWILPGNNITTKPGMSKGPVLKAFSDRIASGKTIIICPIVDMTKVNGNSEVPLLGYAKFELISVGEKGVGSNKLVEITGKFIEGFEPNGVGDLKAGFYGIRSITLIK
jgi:hypothetical protein